MVMDLFILRSSVASVDVVVDRNAAKHKMEKQRKGGRGDGEKREEKKRQTPLTFQALAVLLAHHCQVGQCDRLD